MLNKTDVQAEARCGGVLRGGVYNVIKKTFTFHAGTIEMATDCFDELKILEDIHDSKL